MTQTPPKIRDERETTGGESPLATLRRNLRWSVRRLAKSPGFTLTAVLSIALGIGANTAIFTLVNAVLIRDLPLKSPEELYEVYFSRPSFEYGVFSYPDFRDLRDATGDVFAGMTATRLVITQADQQGGGIETLMGECVNGDYFPVLGVNAQIGRTLLPEDDVAPGAHPVVVLSHDYWQRRFGGDPAAVGRDLRLGGRAYTIVGIAPKDYTGALRGMVPALYVPMMMINEIQPGVENELEARGNHSIFVKARMKPGVTVPEAEGAVAAVAADLRQLDNWDPQGSFRLVPTNDVILMPAIDRFVRAASWLLMVVVGLVLLIACMNLASFLLARTLDRRKEIAVRLALGARRRDLVVQLLTESTLLALLGGIAGVSLAVGLLHLLMTADLPLPLPIELDLSPDMTVLFFSLGISLLTGLLLGLAPALQGSRGDVATTLRTETAGSGQGGKQRLRNGLVVAQVAASLVLLVGAGLFVRSLGQMQNVDPGFGQEPTALMTFMIPSTRYDEEAGQVLARRLTERLEQVPGVEAVGLTGNLHLNVLNTSTMGFNVDAVEPPPEREGWSADRAAVDNGFLEAAGIRLVAGRKFNTHDTKDSQQVAIVSAALAEKFWSETEAVGQMLRRESGDLLVVGVARDAKVRSLGEAPRFFVYEALSQSYSGFLTAVARTRVDPGKTALDMVAAAREVDPELFVWEAKTMERHLGIVLLPSRLSAVLLSTFAVLALVLAVVGLYGIVSYTVVQRQREVGIRMSLGADGFKVLGLLMASGLKLVAIGGVVGLALAFALARLLSGLLFQIDAIDPLTFLALPTLLAAVGALAAFVPARAASRIDPASVLRAE